MNNCTEIYAWGNLCKPHRRLARISILCKHGIWFWITLPGHTSECNSHYTPLLSWENSKYRDCTSRSNPMFKAMKTSSCLELSNSNSNFSDFICHLHLSPKCIWMESYLWFFVTISCFPYEGYLWDIGYIFIFNMSHVLKHMTSYFVFLYCSAKVVSNECHFYSIWPPRLPVATHNQFSEISKMLLKISWPTDLNAVTIPWLTGIESGTDFQYIWSFKNPRNRTWSEANSWDLNCRPAGSHLPSMGSETAREN